MNRKPGIGSSPETTPEESLAEGTVDMRIARFERELHRKIAGTFPKDRLPFFRGLEAEPASSAFERIKRVLQNDDKTWHLFLLALHVLYEGCHDLPPLSASERKALLRDAQSLRSVANRLRGRRSKTEIDNGSATLEQMANHLEALVCPSLDWMFKSTRSRGKGSNVVDAIPVFELANLFEQRLSGGAIYPVIVDLMNALPGRALKYNVQTVKTKLAGLRKGGFRPRVQFVYSDPDVVTLKIRTVATPSQIRVR